MSDIILKKDTTGVLEDGTLIVKHNEGTNEFKDFISGREDVDMKTVEKVREVEKEYVAAVTDADVKGATQIFKDNEDINKVVVVNPFNQTGNTGTWNQTTVIHREKSFKNNMAKEGESDIVTKPIVQSITKRGGGIAKSQLRKYSDYIKEELNS